MLSDISFEKNTRIEISSNLAVLPRNFRKVRHIRIEVSLNLANMLPDYLSKRIRKLIYFAMLPRLSYISFEKRRIRELKYLWKWILLCCYVSFEKNTRIDVSSNLAVLPRIFRKVRHMRIEVSLNLADMLPDVSFEEYENWNIFKIESCCCCHVRQTYLSKKEEYENWNIFESCCVATFVRMYFSKSKTYENWYIFESCQTIFRKEYENWYILLCCHVCQTYLSKREEYENWNIFESC